VDLYAILPQPDRGIEVQRAVLHAELPGVPGTDKAAVHEVALAQRPAVVRAQAVEDANVASMVAQRDYLGPGLPLQHRPWRQLIQSSDADQSHRTDHRPTLGGAGVAKRHEGLRHENFGTKQESPASAADGEVLGGPWRGVAY